MIFKNCLVLVKNEFSQIELSWIFQFHALIVTDTGTSKSHRVLCAGFNSLRAEGAGQGQHAPWPMAQQLPLIELCCQTSGGGPGHGPRGFRGNDSD